MSETLTILPRIDINKARAELCRRDFFYFVQYFWDTIIAEPPVWNWHIPYLCTELQAIGEKVAKREPKQWDYVIINVPPGSSKSTIISEMYPLWCWTIDPTQRFICGSYASTPAEDIAEKCYNIFHSDKFKRLFPELHTRKSIGGKTHFKNGLKGERYTTSTGSSITGIHAHQKIIDDPMNPQIAASKVERAAANTWVSETIGKRNVDDSITTCIVVMQRLHQMDTTGYLLSKQGLRIKHICIPAELSANVKPATLADNYKEGLFDPIRKSREVLTTDKITLGSYGYAGQMQQRPAPEEGGIIKKGWLTIIDTPIPHNVVINFQMDTAYTADKKNDPTAMLAYYTQNNNLFITGVTSVWKEFPDLISWLPTWAKERGYLPQSKIYCEPKASGKSVVQTIKKGTHLNIIESIPPKDDKITRMHLVSPTIEAGRVFLHRGSWNESFIDQLISFPNADHDDEVDTLIATILRELIKTQTRNLANYF